MTMEVTKALVNWQLMLEYARALLVGSVKIHGWGFIRELKRDNNVRRDRFTQDNAKPIMYTDKKDFTLEIAKNSQYN